MQNEISWQAPEHDYTKKTADWFWVVGIVVIALAFAFFISKNILPGILVILAGFSFALYGAKKPSIITFKIGARGIQAGNQLYDYDNIDAFWIDYDPPVKKQLIIKSKKVFSPQITFLLGDADPEEIRKYLLQFTKEERMEESLTATIARILRF